MSQHIFTAVTNQNKPVEVLTGWDRPLSRFYLVIEFKDEKDFNEDNPFGEYLYSNLSDDNLLDGDPKYQTMDYFVSILKEHGIRIPLSLIAKVNIDKLNNEGNREVFYKD